MTRSDTFESSPLDVVAGELDQAADDVARYFSGYTGSQFEVVAGRNGDPNRISTDDIVAVSMLGVNVPAHTAIWLLSDGADTVTELLSSIPADTDLSEVERSAIGSGSPAWTLWELLRGASWRGHGGGMGPTTTSKLLAAKRPRLLPVHDSRVRAALYPTRGSRFDFWEAWRAELAGRPSDCRFVISRLRQAAGAEHLSALRLLDIAIWSYAVRHHLGDRRKRQV